MDMILFEFDEVECVMAASGEELVQEGAIEEADVEKIEDDESDDYFDHSIENMCATFTQEDMFVNSFRETRDHGMDSLREDAVDNFMMGIDSDVENIGDDDDDELLDYDDWDD